MSPLMKLSHFSSHCKYRRPVLQPTSPLPSSNFLSGEGRDLLLPIYRWNSWKTEASDRPNTPCQTGRPHNYESFSAPHCLTVELLGKGGAHIVKHHFSNWSFWFRITCESNQENFSLQLSALFRALLQTPKYEFSESSEISMGLRSVFH